MRNEKNEQRSVFYNKWFQQRTHMYISNVESLSY